jgi:MFS family permease
MPALLGATFLVGGVLGALQVATPALALSRGAPALGGVLIAALSVGGITGALIYGGRRWTADPSVRLLSLLCIVGSAATLLALGPPLPVVGVGLALVGVGLNPVFTTASLLIDRHSGPRAAESFGWMSTAVGGGTALGSAAAGALAQSAGVLSAFLAAAIAAYVAVIIAALARGRLGRLPADRRMSSTASRL